MTQLHRGVLPATPLKAKDIRAVFDISDACSETKRVTFPFTDNLKVRPCRVSAAATPCYLVLP